MWQNPGSLPSFYCIRIFFSYLTLCNTSSFSTWSVQLIFSTLLQKHVTKLCRYLRRIFGIKKSDWRKLDLKKLQNIALLLFWALYRVWQLLGVIPWKLFPFKVLRSHICWAHWLGLAVSKVPRGLKPLWWKKIKFPKILLEKIDDIHVQINNNIYCNAPSSESIMPSFIICTLH
jgi:hypothetical protein